MRILGMTSPATFQRAINMRYGTLRVKVKITLSIKLWQTARDK